MPSRPTPEIDAFIKVAAAKHGIPYELLYCQVQQESRFNPTATSRCGARGLMQIMPKTGIQELGMKESDFFNPEVNLDKGSLYMKRLYKACFRMLVTLPDRHADLAKSATRDDYWKLALASYNCGMGYVFKAINLCVADRVPITWESVAVALADKRCLVRGRDPEEKQTIHYVDTIWKNYEAGGRPK